MNCANDPLEESKNDIKTVQAPEKITVPIEEALYRQNGCESCHGKYGSGNPEKDFYKELVDFRKKKTYRHGYSKSSIQKSIKNGIDGTKMMGYSHLKEHEIEKITEYILELQKIK